MKETKRELIERFTRLGALFHRYHLHRFKTHGPFVNPHRGQGRVLSILKMQPEISQKDLSYLLDMSKQSLAELLGKLEKSGYVTRTQSEQDRRAYLIKLTDEGRENLSETVEADETDDMREIGKGFDCLNEEEQQNLSEYLERIIAEMEKQMADSGINDDNAFHEQLREQFFANGGFVHPHRAFGDFFHHLFRVQDGSDPRMRGHEHGHGRICTEARKEEI